jgi:ApaG protein
MLAHAAVRSRERESRARDDGNPWVAGERRIGQRKPAEVEPRLAGRDDDLHVQAPGAEPGAFVLGLPGRAAIVHHADMFTSEAITRGVRVRVESEYSPDKSQPGKNEWFFLYTVTISNEGADTLQLLTRHWIITDGTGHVEEVRGPGVVGKQPTLRPGEAFSYTSGCPLSTPFGVMEGSYQMISEDGDRFDVKIAPFTLSEPYTVH